MTDHRAIAFQEFVRRHEQNLRAYVARRAPAAVLDDIVQEALVVAWNRFDHVTHHVAPELHRAWLCRVARNVGRDLRRGDDRRERRHRRVHTDPTLAPASVDPWSEIVGDDAAVRFLGRLGADDRELLLAAAWDDFSGRELAELLGCSEPTARKRLSRLTQRLRAELGDGQEGLG